MKYVGIRIPKHCVKDAKSKEKASTSLGGWEFQQLTAVEWIEQLEAGITIQPSAFTPNDKGKFTHKKEFWRGTHFVCCDADNIKGVEFHDDGSDKNPDGVEPWEDINGLSQQYPELKKYAFAVGQSVSSMSEEKPPLHRRYRIIFLFDKLIQSEQHYHHILRVLSAMFPIIPPIERSPAQPVFGNAREGFSEFTLIHDGGVGYFKTADTKQMLNRFQPNVLELSALPFKTDSFEKSTKNRKRKSAGITSLSDYLRQHVIQHTPADEPDKYYVDCPFSAGHTDGIQKPKDSYVFVNESGKFAYHCSHTSCQKGGKTTWESFRNAHGIKKKELPVQLLKNEVEYTEADIDRTVEDETVLEFPEEVLDGVFGDYRDAFKGKTEVPPEFHFAVLKNLIGTSLGRMVYLELDRKTYPNHYTALVGRSALTRKSSAVEHGIDMLEGADENVVTLSSLSTIQGLINVFSQPDTDEDGNLTGGLANYMEGEDSRLQRMVDACHETEGFRVSLYVDELAELLKKGQSTSRQGLMEGLLTLYNFPRKMSNPTKVDPMVAKYPCFNMIAASTYELFENSMTEANIHGGLANRFEYFVAAPYGRISIPKPPDASTLNGVKQVVNQLRLKFAYQTKFTFDDEVLPIFDKWYNDMRDLIEEQQNPLVQSSMVRADLHVKKNALIFAAVRWQDGDEHVINGDDMFKALTLQNYLNNTVEFMYKNFKTSDMLKQEDKIIRTLRKNGELTARDIGRYTHIANTHLVQILDAMVQQQTLGIRKDGRATKYAVLK